MIAVKKALERLWAKIASYKTFLFLFVNYHFLKGNISEEYYMYLVLALIFANQAQKFIPKNALNNIINKKKDV